MKLLYSIFTKKKPIELTTNNTDNNILYFLLGLFKNNKNEILFLKVLVLIIVNTWLLIIFWKVLLINNVNMVVNNVSFTKMNTLLQPVLMYLGLDMLSPSTLTLLMITVIVIIVNLTILNFQGMLGVGVLLVIARYGYKSYTNYLIHLDNMGNIPVEIIKPVEQVVEQAPIIINTQTSSGINWWLWGTVIVVGVITVGGIIFMIWSHNTNANNILSVNETVGNVSQATRATVLNIDEKITRNAQQMQELNAINGKLSNELKELNILTNEKITNLEQGFQTFGAKILKVEENNQSNINLLSQSTLEITKEAKEFFKEATEVSSASEAMILTISKLFDGFTLLEDKVNTLEAKIDSITGATSPRSSLFRPGNAMKNIVKPNNDL